MFQVGHHLMHAIINDLAGACFANSSSREFCCEIRIKLCLCTSDVIKPSIKLCHAQNLTLRDNILFGLPYDEAKYKQVRTLL